ncbi:MAG: Ku protein, partial [Rhodanobacteraceae bacterium]
LKPEDIKSAAPESHESIDVEAFVDKESIAPQFYEKPYFLVPGKKAEKGYVLLRETLRKTGRVGVARVVIRTREYLCAVIPQGDALLLMLLRYPQELVDADDFKLPGGKLETYRVTKSEMQMAEKLIDSMAGTWKPGDYRDEFRARLTKVIEKRMKSKGVVKPSKDDATLPEDAATNVVDFMALLQKSLATKKRTPAGKAAAVVRPKKSAAKAAKPRAASKRRRSG